LPQKDKLAFRRLYRQAKMLFYRVIWKETRTKCCRASVSEERLNFVIVILGLKTN